MRILRVVNLIPTELAKRLHKSAEVSGGWIEAMTEQLRKADDVNLAIACKTESNTQFCEMIEGVIYYSLGYNSKQKEDKIVEKCHEIIRGFQPDLIHIEGTEFLHAKAMLRAGKEKSIPVLIAMQGILNGQYQYQCGQLPVDDMMFSTSLTNIFAAWILRLRKRLWYKPRMIYERQIIEQADYILGRTTWDRAHTYMINKDAQYFSCNEILRNPFYAIRWDGNNMERHSIYVGNGYYALKGLHFVIQALPLLVREYPDMKVYVAGYPPYYEGDKRSFLKKGYAAYLKKLIKDLNVEKHIIFTGPLKAEEVAKKLAHVNVYVLCSAIENSPNTLGEAMTIGTPCIASYVGGVPDMAVDNEEVLYYRNDDPALLAWSIKRIFDDNKLAAQLSENGHKRAIRTHDRKKNVEQLMQVYKEILKLEQE